MIDKKAPEFCLNDHQNKEHCLSDYKGKWVILYFYPRDNTSGCTREAKDFSEKADDFKTLNVVIIGVSKDSPKSHFRFIEKQNLSILLLSDEEHKVIEQYGAWQKKKNYGKEYFGTVRTTFLINPEGTIKKLWEKVKVANHVDDVFQTLKNMINN